MLKGIQSPMSESTPFSAFPLQIHTVLNVKLFMNGS